MQRYKYEITLRDVRAKSLWVYPHQRDTAAMRQSCPTRRRPLAHSTQHCILSHLYYLCEAAPSSFPHRQCVEMANTFFVRHIIYYFKCAWLADVRAKTRLTHFFESVLRTRMTLTLCPAHQPNLPQMPSELAHCAYSQCDAFALGACRTLKRRTVCIVLEVFALSEICMHGHCVVRRASAFAQIPPT